MEELTDGGNLRPVSTLDQAQTLDRHEDPDGKTHHKEQQSRRGEFAFPQELDLGAGYSLLGPHGTGAHNSPHH